MSGLALYVREPERTESRWKRLYDARTTNHLVAMSRDEREEGTRQTSECARAKSVCAGVGEGGLRRRPEEHARDDRSRYCSSMDSADGKQDGEPVLEVQHTQHRPCAQRRAEAER